jgi:hypothetical protein
VGLLFNRQKLNWSGITPQKANRLTGVGLLPKRLGLLPKSQTLNWSGNTPQKAKIKLEWDYSQKANIKLE